jgi:AcrR family transcriptional regulator
MASEMKNGSETPERGEAFEARRMDILRSAASAFADEGFREMSVGRLADRLGVSKPVLYYYAKNKDDLFDQCSQIARDELQEAISSISGSPLSGLGKIRRFFSTYAMLMGSDFGRCHVLVNVSALAPKTRDKEVRARRGLEDAVRQMLVEGQEDGSVRRCDPALTSRALFGAFNGIPRWFHAGGGTEIADVADVYLDIFSLGITRG